MYHRVQNLGNIIIKKIRRGACFLSSQFFSVNTGLNQLCHFFFQLYALTTNLNLWFSFFFFFISSYIFIYISRYLHDIFDILKFRSVYYAVHIDVSVLLLDIHINALPAVLSTDIQYIRPILMYSETTLFQ